MLVPIFIVIILIAGAISVVLFANRMRSTTGSLSRETRAARHERRGCGRRIRPFDVDRARSSRPRTLRRDPFALGRRTRAPARRRGRRVRTGRRGRDRRQPAPVPQPGPADHGRLRSRRFRAGDARVPLAAAGSRRLRRHGQHRQARRHPRAPSTRSRSRSTRRRPVRTSCATRHDPATLAKAKKVYKPAIYKDMSELGIVALYQRCVHLGCRVPFCQTSQWFECPCHGSKYNRVGEKKAGPAPRGLDRFYATQVRRQHHRRHRQHLPRSADRHQHDRPERRGPAVRVSIAGVSSARTKTGATVRDRRHLEERPSALADLDQLHRVRRVDHLSCCRSVLSPKKAASRGQDAREPHARSSTTKISKAAGSSACRVGRSMFAAVDRDRIADLLAARAHPPAPVGELLRQELRRPRRNPVRQLRERRSTTPQSRCSARTATAKRVTAASASTIDQRRQGQLEGAAAQHRGAALRRGHRLPRASRAGSRTRICDLTDIITYGRPGHTDAAVGCRRRWTEERPVDRRPRRVHRVDPDHTRAVAGAERRRR